MAAIDFPASPTVGQIFSVAGTGVTYQWNGTLWLVTAGPGGGMGDFTAVYSGANVPITTTGFVSTFNTILSGNSGGWYNTVNGRFTPPAGKYFISTGVTLLQVSTSISPTPVGIRKNGVLVLQGNSTPGAAANYTSLSSASATVDANGTDYFDVFVLTTVNGNVQFVGGASQNWFCAFPLTGMQGPSGGVPGTVTGDFCATNNLTTTGIPTVYTTYVLDKILTGNSGGYYSVTTGRWTPPAGRYIVGASMTVYAQLQQMTADLIIRKNGTQIARGGQVPAAVNYYGNPGVSLIVDANGSDWFDVQVSCNNATNAVQPGNALFFATPTQGFVGPQGPTGPANPTNVLRGFLSGYVHSGGGGTQALTMGAGSAADSTSSVWINSASAITKTLASAWTAGTGNGGRGNSVALAANTWYWPYMIVNGGNTDMYFDTSITGANAPAGTTAFRRLRPIKTDGSSNIIAHAGLGDYVQWTVPVVDITGGIQNTTSANIGVMNSVPPGYPVKWRGRIQGQNTGTGITFFMYVSTPGRASGIGIMGGGVAGIGSTVGVGASWAEVLTDNLARLAVWCPTPSATTVWLETEGFVDDCGRFD